jgi:hypothetical protein
VAAKKKSAKKKAPARKTAKKKPALLSGGNPQIAMGEGDAPVRAYIAALSGWKRDLAKELDALIVSSVLKLQKAVKWNSPFYGVAGQGWFLSFHVFTKYIKVTFFKGASLKSGPTGGTSKDARWIDIGEDGLDAAQMKAWIKQAAKIPGWMA